MFAISLILCFIGCKKEPEEPEFNILDYVYTVSFESNGGTEINSQAVVLGKTVNEPENPEHKEKPETEKFAGWYTDKQLTKEYDFSTKVKNSFTLYAKWRHEHKGVGEWQNYDDGHFKFCDCGTVQNRGKCNFIDKEIKTKATCTQEGKKTVYCTVCEYEKEETIPAKGHTLGIWTTKNEPTETEKGQMQSVCEVCGETVTKDLLEAPEGFRFVNGGTITGSAYTNNSKGVFIEGRSVTLSNFYMGKYEVTQEEYARVMAGQKVTVDGVEYTLESDPSYCKKDSTSYTLFEGEEQSKRPVEGVTWYDAVWYCNALSAKERLDPAYVIEVTTINSSNHITAATVSLVTNANGYRLPTEAEWEYAARGGEPNAADWNYTFSGVDTAADASYSSSKNSGLDNVGWYWYNTATGTTGNSPSSGSQGYGTHQVGKKAANALGLYDMSGNVWEWCYDWYGTVNTGTETAPTGAASGSYRVYRGGSWYNSANYASVSYRGSNFPSYRYYNLGFRVVRSSSN